MPRTMNAIAATSILALMLASGPAFAEMLTYKVELKGTAEVPPTDSAASGTADTQVDTETKKMTWTTTHRGLSGDPTGAHFHGPAAADAVADPAIDITANMASGSADLSDAQLADLQAGMLYVNIHSAKFPGGEIRGQVVK